nr:phosphopantetheine-binding protein [uncultured Rhodopila sp.]
MNTAERAAIREFIGQRLAEHGDADDFSDDEPLFSGARLDSVSAIETVAFLERRFGVDFLAAGFDMGKIDSVEAMLALVVRAVA